ncbi:MAG: hypothetical protein COA58_04660 [Bacteroidetes bacterium]|nr:MAG: hypothetical protein COA58_04660 [Bacteroidota bacterium]
MKKKILRKMTLLAGLLMLSLTNYAQGESDTSQPILDPNPRFECNFIGIEQEFILHFKDESALSIDFSQTPTEPLQILDKDNNIVAILDQRKNAISLPTYQHFAIQGKNSCGEIGLFYTFNTIPQINREGFGLPRKIYSEWTTNFGEGQSQRTIDFLRENKNLSVLEKLLIIQEYYFDGDLAITYRGEMDNENDDPPLLGGLRDSILLNTPPFWGRMNDAIDVVVWGEPTDDCHCKTTWGFSNNGPGPVTTHSIYLQKNYTPYKWYEHDIDHPSKVHKGGSNRYTEYRNATKGAAKMLDGKMYMKGSHSDRYQQKFPDPAQAASTYRTVLGYTLACENKQEQDDNCMCNDRILEYTASYVNSVSTNAKENTPCFLCGNGWSAYAQAEDWAILTVSSKKQGIKIVDAGRANSKSEKNTTVNKDWNIKIIDLAASVTASAVTGGTSSLVDSALIKRAAEDIKYLIYNPPNYGGGSTYNSGGNELLGGCGSEYSVTLRPNDPTNIMIHSYGAFDLGGHTKWESTAHIGSDDYLAAYMDYKETDECCNEEVFNWVIGVNGGQQNLNALRCINAFYQLGPVNIPAKYSNGLQDLWWTDRDEWGSEVSSKCPSSYFEVFVVQNDDHIIPLGTSYQVASILTGTVLMTSITVEEITLGDLKTVLANEGSFRHSFYSLKLVSHNEVQYLKIYID